MKRNILFLAILMSACYTVAAQLRPAGIFADNAVFQQRYRIPVWGWTTPGTAVEVVFAGHKKSGKADVKGAWRVYLPAMKADGKTYQLTIESAGQRMTYNNIKLGEVWLASGQSNMAYTVGSDLNNKADEIRAANYPDIRFRMVENITDIIPDSDIANKPWAVCSPKSISNFSAVAYFFARAIHLDQKVPVGIICASRGSTSIESWMSKESLLKNPEFTGDLKTRDEDPAHWNDIVQKSAKEENEREYIAKTSFKGLTLGVNKVDYDDSEWKKAQFPLNADKMGIPGYWGVFWVRKTFDMTAEQAQKPWVLSVPITDRNDIVYLNGKEIARDLSRAKGGMAGIPPGTLNSGKNVLAMRVYVNWGAADIGNRINGCFLISGDNQHVDLSGIWSSNSKIETEVAPRSGFFNTNTVNFNAMINPLIPYAIRGFIWYQGENNVRKPKQYSELLPMMIDDWRTRWQEKNAPFLIVQLAGYHQRLTSAVSHDDLAELRDAQQHTAATVPHAGMAGAVDIGDELNIHPGNKQDVGKRLFLAALQQVYKPGTIGSGPAFRSTKIEGDSIRIKFLYTKNGLVAKDQMTNCFAVSDANGKWTWADARIDGTDIVVSCKSLKTPVEIQYGWQSNPSVPLYNTEGLPMVPFKEKINR